MKSKLSSLCFYAKGKVEVSSLTKQNYVSTENMLPNKGGLTYASSLPSMTYTQQYLERDVLVSNIRPYFKKIWYADKNGGCSNDILVFRALPNCDPSFLYCVLANDYFFDYSTTTSKGTKMPRGDRAAIMEYEVPNFNINTQKKIATLIFGLNNRITNNIAINDNLAA